MASAPPIGSRSPGPRIGRAGAVTFGLVGWLFFVEIVSGLLQGYYIPLVSPLARVLGIDDPQFNWFEAAQLLVSAIALPVLAKLGDMIGHKRILLISSALTAAASWWLIFAGDFTSFLLAWALQGFYVVWLPLEVAIIFSRARSTGVANATTRRAAGLLVVALQLGAIIGALLGGRLLDAFGGATMPTLAIPAIGVTLVFFVVLFGVPKTAPEVGRRTLDLGGFALLGLGLLLITSSLTFLRINGVGAWWVWALLAAGLLSFLPFGWYELRRKDPAIDLRVLRTPSMWPVQTTAGLFGISVLGAQVPLSTFVATDPAAGYGFGLSASSVSNLIGAYLLSVIIGAIAFSFVARRTTPRLTLIGAAMLVGVGYLMFIPFHGTVVNVVVNMLVAGLGSGALLAALPAAAAAAAPLGQTGIAAGLTNTTKTIGGSFSSAIFGVALASGAVGAVATAGSLAGYYTVWLICGGTAIVSAVLLVFVPKLAFSDPPLVEERTGTEAP
ncbi:MFS transporter [Naasia lichenicola]|uniref:MFS transporter n=1 Tax=Naasia lichenicola TaxID=2565933 RepID=A0A4S4FFR0_9MICO|nr:MFS transporter [Naasia lichenicola]THG28572.1 MFS transporter [Naasia lichenicola]